MSSESRINLTLILNVQSPALKVDRVQQVMMEKAAEWVKELKHDLNDGIPPSLDQPGDGVAVTSINVLEGLSLNIGFGPGDDLGPEYMPRDISSPPGVGGRWVATPHGPRRGPTEEMLDAADRGEYDQPPQTGQ